ncbi:PIN domain-containing protein [Advenella kashmirensis]
MTQAELLFGLAKRPQSKSLHALVHEFLRHIEVLPRSSDTAASYGKLRASLEKNDRCLGASDLLIAAHAVSQQAVLVTNDRAFTQLHHIAVEGWSE